MCGRNAYTAVTCALSYFNLENTSLENTLEFCK